MYLHNHLWIVNYMNSHVILLVFCVNNYLTMVAKLHIVCVINNPQTLCIYIYNSIFVIKHVIVSIHTIISFVIYFIWMVTTYYILSLLPPLPFPSLTFPSLTFPSLTFPSFHFPFFYLYLIQYLTCFYMQ